MKKNRYEMKYKLIGLQMQPNLLSSPVDLLYIAKFYMQISCVYIEREKEEYP